ncbi:MAG: hypothetical protein Q7W13_14075 [Bacteroidia bacterium]|nr:hypothetical protein [Bacteroidia bacterium]
MAKKKEVTAKNSENRFSKRKESVLMKCKKGGVIQPYLTEIENTKNDVELDKVMSNNVELRPFVGE